jgi:hypothetical protein
MTHAWYCIFGTEPRCQYCGVRQREAKSAECDAEEIKKRWEELAKMIEAKKDKGE